MVPCNNFCSSRSIFMKFEHNHPCYNTKNGIENEGCIPTVQEARSKALKLVDSYFREQIVYFCEFDTVFFIRFLIKISFSSMPTDLTQLSPFPRYKGSKGLSSLVSSHSLESALVQISLVDMLRSYHSVLGVALYFTDSENG